jgi:uncharacterized protein (DUF1684 family)
MSERRVRNSGYWGPFNESKTSACRSATVVCGISPSTRAGSGVDTMALMLRTNFLAIVAIAGMAAAADKSTAAYEREIAEWRAQREAKLKAEDGWLTLVGLDWLKDGENRVGSNPAFEVPLPNSAPEHVGVITVKDGRVHFKPAAGAPVTINNQPAHETDLKPDTEPNYDILAIGRVKFYVIKRENKLGVRVKDNDNAARKHFTGLRWYPVDPSWRIQAKFIPWDKPHALTFDTAAGVKEKDESPGYATFERNGKEYRLEPVVEGKVLFFVLRDQTSGKTTYGASRFLYTDLPKDGKVELDFNRAENPPCVFTDYATCPLPLPQNRLPLAITAGEQMYGNHH